MGDRARNVRFARPPCWRAGAICIALGLCALAQHAMAEIYKCTDKNGNVTYQNEKCPSGGKIERVDIFDNNWTANRSEKEAEWQRNAADRRVTTGMPARWVREGFGDPAEIRETTTGGAKEIWVYSLPDKSLQVGMLDDQVVWVRETPVTVPAARMAPPPENAGDTAARSSSAAKAATRPIDILNAPEALRSPDAASRVEPSAAKAPPPSPEVARMSDASRGADAPRASSVSPAIDASRRVARGRDCKEVLAELGPPDRQRELPASDVLDSGAMTEYVYEPAGGAAPTRTRILCANGKVEGVDRSVAR
jgi:hypothetical protein